MLVFYFIGRIIIYNKVANINTWEIVNFFENHEI